MTDSLDIGMKVRIEIYDAANNMPLLNEVYDQCFFDYKTSNDGKFVTKTLKIDATRKIPFTVSTEEQIKQNKEFLDLLEET